MDAEKVARLEKLLARELTPEERDRFSRIQDILGIANNDALWDVIITLEHHRVYYEDIPQKLSQTVERMRQDIREMAGHEAAIAQNKLAQAVVEQARKLSTRINLIGMISWGTLILVASILAGATLMWAGYSIGSGQTHPPVILLRMPVGIVAGGLSLGCGLFLMMQCAKGYADGRKDLKKLILAASAFIVPGAMLISMT